MSSTVKVIRGILFIVLALFLVASLVNCGGSSSDQPPQVAAPTDLIKDFLVKHDLMFDKSLVDFYVADEQPTIAVAVERAMDEKKAAGELENLQNASFDFSNLKIEVVGEKEVYIHDEPRKVIKVAVSGSYVVKGNDSSQTVPADDTVILQMVDNTWKVTEKVNPWKEYRYKKSG